MKYFFLLSLKTEGKPLIHLIFFKSKGKKLIFYITLFCVLPSVGVEQGIFIPLCVWKAGGQVLMQGISDVFWNVQLYCLEEQQC